MDRLPQEIMEILKDPDTIKVIATIGEEGNPHIVMKDSLEAIDEQTIAYLELIERSNTSKNMLRNFWDKKQVSIFIYNKKAKVSCQIKTEPYKYEWAGPLWDQFLTKLWQTMPDANPETVWVLKVKQVINEDYFVRREEQDKRVITQKVWHPLRGPRS